MKACIYTLGCKVNAYESQFVISSLEENGYEIVPFGMESDVVIINTCSVTNNSDAKSRKMIHQAVRNYPNSCIVVMGCFIEANHDLKIDGVNIILGNKDKSKIVSILDDYFKTKENISRLYSYKQLGSIFENMDISSFKGRTRAFIKIQDGCENFCTYCIIPYVRGKCRSKSLDKVLREVNTLVNNGYKEIVLTGIHTGNYGSDLGLSFKDLLEKLILIPNLYRVRISSIEVTELNHEVLHLLTNKIFAHHLHIPLQAGSDHVLKMMNRKYDLNFYENKIKEIRELFPDISISTDIIVGFPGEENADFENTMEFAKRMKFSKIHVFPYSVRKNTPAAYFENQVDPKVKKERKERLNNLSRELEMEYFKTNIGKTLEVLIEENDGEYSYGHTSNYLYAKIKGVYNSEDLVLLKAKEVMYPYVLFGGEKEKVYGRN